MNNPSIVELLSQTKQYEQHRKKISKIMTSSTNSLSFRKNEAFNNFYSNRQKAARYSLKTKQDTVDKQNDLILKKIIDLNRKDRSNYLPPRHASHNLESLRKKMQLTNEENLKIANKLVATTSKLSQSILCKEYGKQTAIKERLQKYTVDEYSGQIIPKKYRSMAKLRRLDPMEEDYPNAEL